MNEKTQLTAQDILKKKFTRNVRGYDPDEVDDFLDLVIKDYVSFGEERTEVAANVSSLENQLAAAKAAQAKAEADAKVLWDAKKNLEIDNASMAARLKGIKPGDKINAENIQYIQRIRELEDFLNSEGYDTNHLKRKPRS
jgi:DivIVA domain-containing protein